MKRSLLLFTVLCLGCQKPTPQSVTGSLPTPPFTDLRSTTLSPEPPSLPVSTATLEETIASIKRLQTDPNASAYRPRLELLAAQVFQKVASSDDPEAVIMTLLATAACNHPLSLQLSRELIRSSNPIIQLVTVQALSALNSADGDIILAEALRSDYPVIRLEAAWRLANRRTKDSFFQIDALLYKLPPEMAGYLPELFAIEGSPKSILRLQQFLFSPNEELVLQTLLAIGRNHLSSLASSLSTFQSHSPAILEALAFALEAADSEQTRSRLHLLATHQDCAVRIRAALSLISLGELAYQEDITSLAFQGNPFAANALGDCPEPLPKELLHASFPKPFQLNIALSLLSHKQGSCVPQIKQLLLSPDESILTSSASLGQSIGYWQFSSLESFDKELWPAVREQTLVAKEMVLTDALDLDQDDFLDIASALFANGRVELYPVLLQLLTNQQSDKAITLLTNEANRPGAPYNRAFATLGLFRLGVEKEDKALFASILDLSREKELQSWRFPLPWMAYQQFDEKNPQQHAAATAKLYIETIETLATSASPEAVELLTEELDKAPPKYLPFVVTALLHTSL